MTRLGQQLRAKAATLRALADDLDLQAESVEDTAPTAEALNLQELKAYGFTRQSLRSAAEKGLPVHRGPRGRIICYRADVDAWIKSRAWTPSSRKAERTEDDALAQAEAELMALGGCVTRAHQLFSAESANGDENTRGLLKGKRALSAVGGQR